MNTMKNTMKDTENTMKYEGLQKSTMKRKRP